MGSASWSPLLSPPPHLPPFPQPPGPQPGSLSGACQMLFRPLCGQGSQAEVWTPLLRPPPFLRLLAHSQNRGAPAQLTETSALVEPGGGGPETDSRHAQLAAVWEVVNPGERSAGAGRTESAGQGSARGSAAGGGDSRREPAPGELGSSWTPTAPAGVPHSARKTGEQLRCRAGQRKPRPALRHPRALRSRRLGSHRLRGCLERGTCAPMRQPQS